jgi:hypothetical protein
MLFKKMYNDFSNPLSKPHAPYLLHFVYSAEQSLDIGINNHMIENKSQYNSNANDDERHDVLFYRKREGVYGCNIWKVPELKVPNLNEFKKSKAKKKTIVFEGLAFDDPQVYWKSIRKESLFRDDCYELWNHKWIGLDVEDLWNSYFERIASNIQGFDSYKEHIRNLKEELECDNIVVPLQYSETYHNSGLLNDDDIMFVNNNLPINIDLFKPYSNFEDRDIDCFISGADFAGVYPFRYIARKVMENNTRFWKTFDNSNIYREYLQKRHAWTKKFDNDVQLGVRTEYSDFFLNQLFGDLDSNQYNDYLMLLKRSKIVIGCSSVFGYPLKKYIEAMGMGCVVVGELPKFANKYGIIDGIHMVVCKHDEIEHTINSLLNDKDRMSFISKNARDLIDKRYSSFASAKELLTSL